MIKIGDRLVIHITNVDKGWSGVYVARDSDEFWAFVNDYTRGEAVTRLDYESLHKQMERRKK